MSDPSGQAVEAAGRVNGWYGPSALRAAHDPALGFDRSVCLRDVLDALWEHGSHGRGEFLMVRDFIKREFGTQDKPKGEPDD